MSARRMLIDWPSWFDALVLRSVHDHSASAYASGMGTYAADMVAVTRTQPLVSSDVAETATPVRAGKRQRASSVAPTGRGSGAQTSQSRVSKRLAIITHGGVRWGRL